MPDRALSILQERGVAEEDVVEARHHRVDLERHVTRIASGGDAVDQLRLTDELSFFDTAAAIEARRP
jgi:hypothetical protein